jgi:hypothetical protein
VGRRGLCTGAFPVTTQRCVPVGEETTNPPPRRSSPQAEGDLAASLTAPPADGPLEGAVHPTGPPRSERQHVENSPAPLKKLTEVELRKVITRESNRSRKTAASIAGLTRRAITDAETPSRTRIFEHLSACGQDHCLRRRTISKRIAESPICLCVFASLRENSFVRSRLTHRHWS